MLTVISETFGTAHVFNPNASSRGGAGVVPVFFSFPASAFIFDSSLFFLYPEFSCTYFLLVPSPVSPFAGPRTGCHLSRVVADAVCLPQLPHSPPPLRLDARFVSDEMPPLKVLRRIGGGCGACDVWHGSTTTVFLRGWIGTALGRFCLHFSGHDSYLVALANQYSL